MCLFCLGTLPAHNKEEARGKNYCVHKFIRKHSNYPETPCALHFSFGHFLRSKALKIAPARRQKNNKKEPGAIRNELLWTLLFYSVPALNAARKGTNLGAELG